jgi:hypothetical protein
MKFFGPLDGRKWRVVIYLRVPQKNSFSMCDCYILGRFYKKGKKNFFVWWLKTSMVTKDVSGRNMGHVWTVFTFFAWNI